jgi:hypothetical protein
VPANHALDMAREFTPKQPTRPFKLLIELPLAADLDLIAAIRTKVNKANGATTDTTVSVTEMLMEGAADVRNSQFADWKEALGSKFGKNWEGKPSTDEQVAAIIEHEVAKAKALLPQTPKLAILAESKKSSQSR